MAPRQINLFQVAGSAAPPGIIKEVRLMMIKGPAGYTGAHGRLSWRIGRLDEMIGLSKGDI